ncbi:L-cystine-binding protein FliY [Pandoraea terrae]|uniref:L-cystine-binding protein FliY n=1 Tax=Pandoraea terrae TaxID=1537710 RepID=A0A5E4TIR4_9BURK|nr:transporter substrate-binding domain-containing protein [Pandoraea terrae]VVD87896.1 L-cystine-binding protein FliY [Pandoraea terrae]
MKTRVLAGVSMLLASLLAGVAHAGCLDDVKAAGVLRSGNGLMGTKPFVWTNTDGTYGGFEAELLREVGQRIGVPKTEYVVTEWSTLIPGLKSRRWDIILSAMSATQERVQSANIQFSKPYFLMYDLLIVKDDSAVRSVDQLKKMTVGTTLGTNDSLNAHRMADAGKIGRVLDFNTFGEPFLALQNGQVDAVLLDQGTLYGQREKMKNLRVVGEPVFYAPKPEWAAAEAKVSYRFGTTAIAVRSECSDLLNAVNHALDTMEADGTRQRILTKYGVWSPEQTKLTKQ